MFYKTFAMYFGPASNNHSPYRGIGVITYLLLSGTTPFGGDSEEDDLQVVRNNILRGEVSFEDPCWAVVSDEAINFIKSLVSYCLTLHIAAHNDILFSLCSLLTLPSLCWTPNKGQAPKSYRITPG